MRSLHDILQRIEQREAVVLTSQEVCEIVSSGQKETLLEVDVVTTATRAVMSGTYAVLSFPVAEPGSFRRAIGSRLNGVPAFVGPCPNENLGIVDLIVYGTMHRLNDSNYGGGHLFRDLVERKSISADIELKDGKKWQTEITLDDMPHAMLFGSRHAFKNYSAFVNSSNEPIDTIFHVTKFEPGCLGATFSGCGQINPLKNDPFLDAIGVGTRILLNGAEGFVLSKGTRGSSERPNLAGFADMHEMEPEYMGGFKTSAGPECICSWAVPIPVISPTILNEIGRLDKEIPLPVLDVISRECLATADYGQVWDGVDLKVDFYSKDCLRCECCQVEGLCPMGALSSQGELKQKDEHKCFNCGACIAECLGGAFRCNLGSIRVLDREVPVRLRQSDRFRAQKLAIDLKERILEGSFRMAPPVDRIFF
ncbi:MAG: methanogenesis marker 16 metalloprotein [Methanotrichaceae archaeon]|nr:methanogenesis marker 16 metalloprotein [Methanotrichaceae archaeon]MDD1758382.1 methanogenesis marker 16 metalloprotein [Methanotrichaceae archaeon]